MKETKSKTEPQKANFSTDADSPRHASEWFGAILTYFFRRQSRSFNEIYNRQHRGRNILIGYLFQLLLLAVGIWLAIRYWWSDLALA